MLINRSRKLNYWELRLADEAGRPVTAYIGGFSNAAAAAISWLNGDSDAATILADCSPFLVRIGGETHSIAPQSRTSANDLPSVQAS